MRSAKGGGTQRRGGRRKLRWISEPGFGGLKGLGLFDDSELRIIINNQYSTINNQVERKEACNFVG